MALRKFFGLVAIALALVATVSEARPIRGGSQPVAVGFNGGKSQVGVNFLQIANDFAFMNAVKGGQSWNYGDNSGFPDPTELDSNGYPIAGSSIFLSHSGVRTVFYIPTQTERPGNYVVTWDGISNIGFTFTHVITPTATFTGSVASGILTAGAPSGGTIQKGMILTGTGVSSGTIIGDQITGSAGQAGTYFVIGTTTAGSTSMSVNGGSTTGSSATGNRYVLTPGATAYRVDMGFSAATQTPSNLKFFHVDDEAEINAGEILGKKFRQNWAFLNAGVIRFGDWQYMNLNNSTTWATRKPVNYVFYDGQEYRASLWAGLTTNVGNAYTAPLTPSSWGGLVDKAIVTVRFNAADTTDAATLNVAGTGAIPVRNQWGSPTSASFNNRIGANAIGTLTYDATLGVWLKHGGTSSPAGLNNGVPPEVMLTVATKLGAHPYVTTPYLAGDPLTDYMPSLATYYRDNAPSWMIPRYEGTNETWNFAFFGSQYALNKSNAYWGAADVNQWYGKEISLLGQAISSVYSANRARYQVLAGVQTVFACGNSSCSVDGTASSNPRLTSANWIASGPSQAGYSNAAGVGEAYRWVTHVTMANYVQPSRAYKLQELKDGFAYSVTNAGNPTAQAVIVDDYVSTLGGAAAIYNNAYVTAAANFWYGWGQNNWGGSIKIPVAAYEGGYSPDYVPNNWTSPITGAAVTSGTTVDLTLATTENLRYNGGTALSGNPAVAGMSLSIASVGGMTQLNGNTYTVAAVSGNTVTLTIPSTAGFGAYTSGGTSTYVNSALYANTIRWAGKFSPQLATQTTAMYNGLAAIPLVFPSQFLLSGSSVTIDSRLSGNVGTGQVWGLWDQTVYSSPYSTAADSIRAFNTNWLLERDLDPASNDNDPMWLEKAA